MKIKVVMRDFRRRYREPAIRLLIRLFSRLPFFIVLKIGGLFGWVLWIYNGEMRKVTEKNLALCFPEYDQEKRKRLARSSLIETGKNITEIATLWLGPPEKVRSLIKNVEGEAHIQNAIEAGRGVILLSPHLGAWEMMGLYVSEKYSVTSMYRPPEMKSLENIVRNGRSRFGAQLVPTDVTGVRGLLSALKKNEVIGVLPDQDPGQIGGEFVPLFNQLANTPTLTSKLANKSNADAIACYARRKKSGTGYDLYFSPANKHINEKNTTDSAKAINEEIEKLILKSPEQYQWSYKRFKTRPAGENNIYS